MARNKVNTKDYANLPIEKWNATTFRAYMSALHKLRLGIPYVANNYALEGRWLNNMAKEYGNEALKRFITRCIDTYKPTPRYPGINFGFMYSYLRERHLPPVLVELAKEELRAKRTEQAESQAIDTNWF